MKVTHTHTYATVTREGRKFVEDRLVRVKRKPTESDSLYLSSGHYEVHTANGPVKVQGPVYILYDIDGYPYPVEVSIFFRTWAAA